MQSDHNIPMRFWYLLEKEGDKGMGEHLTKPLDDMPVEFYEIVDELVRLTVLARETGTHAPDEWKGEDIDKVRFKADRHLARARYGSYIDDQFKLSAYVHAIWRYMQEYTLVKKNTQNLMERLR